MSFWKKNTQTTRSSSDVTKTSLVDIVSKESVKQEEEEEKKTITENGQSPIMSQLSTSSTSSLSSNLSTNTTQVTNALHINLTLHTIENGQSNNNSSPISNGLATDSNLHNSNGNISLSTSPTVSFLNRNINEPTPLSPSIPYEEEEDAVMKSKVKKFEKLYEAQVVDIDDLRSLSWSGIPSRFRPWAWQLLMGYLPLNKDRRQTTLDRKRKEYMDCVEQYFGKELSNKGDYENVDNNIFHQIKIDVPRTSPDIPLFLNQITHRSLERILYVWTIRHPASGYVQGINNLVTPFFIVFLTSYIEGNPETYDPSKIPAEVFPIIEADSYWCLSKLIDGIQDNFISGQPGIQRQVFKLQELVGRIDATLNEHLEKHGIEYIQFAFRWMNCLLMREIAVRNIPRMWDTYMAEGVDGYSTFHLYVCAAFLTKWAKDIKKMDFQETMIFLQNPPSLKWGLKEIEIILSEAFMWKSLFHNSPSHLNRRS